MEGRRCAETRRRSAFGRGRALRAGQSGRRHGAACPAGGGGRERAWRALDSGQCAAAALGGQPSGGPPAGSAAPVLAAVGPVDGATRAATWPPVPGGAVPPSRPGAGRGRVRAGRAAARALRRTCWSSRRSRCRRVLLTVHRGRGVTAAEPLEAATMQVNGALHRRAGRRPVHVPQLRRRPTAASDAALARGRRRRRRRLLHHGQAGQARAGRPGHRVGPYPEAAGRSRSAPWASAGSTPSCSRRAARSLGVPAGNAIVISARARDVAVADGPHREAPPEAGGGRPLVSAVATGGGSASGGAAGPAPVAERRRRHDRGPADRRSCRGGEPPGPAVRLGRRRPDVVRLLRPGAVVVRPGGRGHAAGRRRPGQNRPAVPVSQLQPGDLLFYHTDPTDPGYISHVAIYLGNGWMIQAPEPGKDVQIVPADFGTEFAGAIRVYPRGPPPWRAARVLSRRPTASASGWPYVLASCDREAGCSSKKRISSALASGPRGSAKDSCGTPPDQSCPPWWTVQLSVRVAPSLS